MAGEVPTLLLHSCCAPCSSYVLEYLSQYFSITLFYYNPNIYPPTEYEHRVEEQQRLIRSLPAVHPISFCPGPYDSDRWQHRKMATADVLFEVPGQKLRQDMLYELIFLKLVTANALCSRSFSCKGRSYFCHISHDTRKPAEPYVLRVSKE